MLKGLIQNCQQDSQPHWWDRNQSSKRVIT